jgi:hypothetical protein
MSLRPVCVLPDNYCVSTVGRDERVIREYIQNHEQEDACLDQLRVWN